VVLAHPPGYDLVDETVETARRFAKSSGGSFAVTDSMATAFEHADVVYPKNLAPAAVMRERTRILRSGEKDKLKELEREALATNAKHKDWECNEAMMRGTKGGGARYMHCLPADVTDVSCAAGEVSNAVFEKARVDTYREAGHKPFIVAARWFRAAVKQTECIVQTFECVGDRCRPIANRFKETVRRTAPIARRIQSVCSRSEAVVCGFLRIACWSNPIVRWEGSTVCRHWPDRCRELSRDPRALSSAFAHR